jgi:hypothetical protein
MKHLATFITTGLMISASAEAKPLKVFILAGQSNMEGQMRYFLDSKSKVHANADGHMHDEQKLP